MKFKPYFLPLAVVTAGLTVPASAAEMIPVGIAEGFTHDVIAENSPASEYASSIFDFSCFFTSNVFEEGALCSADAPYVVTNNGTKFELGALDGNNALFVEKKNTEYTLRFAEGVAAEKLYVLCACTTARNHVAVIEYEDGTFSEEIEFDLPISNYTSSTKDRFAVWDLMVIYDDELDDSSIYGLNEVVLESDPTKTAVAVTFACSKTPELLVLGVSALADTSGTKIRLTPSSSKLNVGPETTENLILYYDMNGEEKAADFYCTATVSDECISIGDITEDAEACCFTVPVTAVSESGMSDLTLTVHNGELEKSCVVKVKVRKPSDFAGWNCDVIAEATPSNLFVSSPLDEAGWALYSDAVKAEGAIAGDNRIITTNGGVVFELEPYDEPNALRLKRNEAAVLTANVPTACTALHILAISANGEANVNVTVNYSDGTSEEAVAFVIPDWFGDSEGAALHGFDRIFTCDDDWDNELDQFDGRCNFRLYDMTLPVDSSKELQSVAFEHSASTVYPTILSMAKETALSGVESAGEVAVPTVVGIYNLNGMKVSRASDGIFIVRYSDGSARKIIMK